MIGGGRRLRAALAAAVLLAATVAAGAQMPWPPRDGETGRAPAAGAPPAAAPSVGAAGGGPAAGAPAGAPPAAPSGSRVAPFQMRSGEPAAQPPAAPPAVTAAPPSVRQAPATPSAAAPSTVAVDRPILSAPDISLAGETASVTETVYLSATEAARPATLSVGMLSAVVVMPEASRLTVTINGEPVMAEPITSAGRVRRYQARLPAGVLRAGSNRVRIAVEQRHRVDCSVQATFELWSLLQPATTGLSFEGGPVALSGLADLPAVGLGDTGSTSLVVFGPFRDGPLGSRFSTVAAVTSAAAVLGRFAHPVVEPAVGDRPGPRSPGRLAVVVGTAIAVLPVTAVGAGEAEQGPTVAFATDPATGVPTLVVSGPTPADVETAVQRLRSVAAEAVYPGEGAGRWRFPDVVEFDGGEARSFAELGLRTQEVSGRRFAESFGFLLPADFYGASSGTARLRLDAAFTEEVGPGSVINIRVNGQVTLSLRLATTRGGLFDKRRINVPMQFFRPGYNRIELETVLVTQSDIECPPGMSGTGEDRFVLFDSSVFEMPDFARFGSWPNLAAFSADAFPYAVRSDRPLAVYLGGGTAAAPAAATLLARLSVDTGTPIRAEIVPDEAGLTGRPALIVATAADVPASVVTATGLSLPIEAWRTAGVRLPQPGATPAATGAFAEAMRRLEQLQPAAPAAGPTGPPIDIGNPERTRALYDQWRRQVGDDATSDVLQWLRQWMNEATAMFGDAGRGGGPVRLSPRSTLALAQAPASAPTWRSALVARGRTGALDTAGRSERHRARDRDRHRDGAAGLAADRRCHRRLRRGDRCGRDVPAGRRGRYGDAALLDLQRKAGVSQLVLDQYRGLCLGRRYHDPVRWRDELDVPAPARPEGRAVSARERKPQPMTAEPASRRVRISVLAAAAVAMATAATVLVAHALDQAPDGGATAASGPAAQEQAQAPLIVPQRQPAAGDSAAPDPAAASAASAAPAPALTVAPATASPSTASGAAAGAASPEVDDSALRYFLQQGDARRAQAEMQRLHRLYPNWEPPANLFDPNAPMPSDVQPIWDLYGAGDYAAARRAVAERQAADPTWTPPDDLVAALDQAGERQRLLNAADVEQWETVLTIADGAPSILTCDNIEVLWRVAEAFARTGKEQRAVDAETYIVEHCPGAAPKVAALQKALDFLPVARIEALLARAVDPPASDPAFDVVRLEIARRQVSAANDDPALTAPAAALTRLATAALADGGAADALLLGFYAYRHGDAQGATGWFLYALQRGGGAKAAEGYVLAMQELGRQIEAEPVAYEWRTAGRENMAAYLTAITTALTTGDASLIEQPVLDRFSRTVAEQRSPLGAQALGWYAYNAGQPEVAADWFSASLAWHPSEVAAYGLGLAYRSLDDGPAFQDVLRTWIAQFPRLPELYVQGGAAGATALSGTSARTGTAAVTAGARRTPMSADAESILRELGLSDDRVARRAPPADEALRLVSPASDRAAMAPESGPLALDEAAATGAGPRRTQGIGCGGAGAGTLAAGWCLMEQDRPFEAAQAFAQAGGGEAAFGAALAYLRMGLTRDAALAAARAPLDATRRHQIETSLVTQVATDAYERGKFTQALEALDQRRALAPEQNDLMMLRGWSYYEMGDFISARRMFEAVDAVAPTPATRRALNTVNLRMTPRSFRDQ